jgi:hypothetical protein
MHSSLKKILYNLTLGDSESQEARSMKIFVIFFCFIKTACAKHDKISSEIRKKE